MGMLVAKSYAFLSFGKANLRIFADDEGVPTVD